MKKDNLKKLKNKLKERKPTFGSWITTGHANIAEIMAQSGFEWLTIDMEHSCITLDIAQHLIQAIESCDVVPLVRVGEKNPNLIKRVMDEGAYGVIVPMVNSKEDAKLAVNAVKYPPVGTRGVGLARAQKYGFDFEGYKSSLEDAIVIVQIEHIDAINNLEEILSVKGVDGCIIGPYDLSGSLGIPGKFEDKKVKNALDKFEKTCTKMKKSFGMHVIPPDHKKMLENMKKGYTFLALSLDSIFLGTICRDELKKLKDKLK